MFFLQELSALLFYFVFSNKLHCGKVHLVSEEERTRIQRKTWEWVNEKKEKRSGEIQSQLQRERVRKRVYKWGRRGLFCFIFFFNLIFTICNYNHPFLPSPILCPAQHHPFFFFFSTVALKYTYSCVPNASASLIKLFYFNFHPTTWHGAYLVRGTYYFLIIFFTAWLFFSRFIKFV